MRDLAAKFLSIVIFDTSGTYPSARNRPKPDSKSRVTFLQFKK